MSHVSWYKVGSKDLQEEFKRAASTTGISKAELLAAYERAQSITFPKSQYVTLFDRQLLNIKSLAVLEKLLEGEGATRAAELMQNLLIDRKMPKPVLLSWSNSGAQDTLIVFGHAELLYSRLLNIPVICNVMTSYEE